MASDADIRDYFRGLGEKIGQRGKISDRQRARYDAAHEAEGVEDFGDTIDVGEIPDAGAPPEPPTVGAPPGPDEPPAHARRERRSRRAGRDGEPRDGARGRRTPTRVTHAIQGDIRSKVELVLAIPGEVWAARDPVCGGTFVQARPDIADAFTEIICGSPDLVAWFTGQGGQFMLYLNLAAACWPVVMVIMAHHVYHTVELAEGEQPGEQQDDYSRYAA